jgi:hypothetical protein
MTEHYNELFPNGNHQERATNFSEFYLEYGDDLILKLSEYLEPLELKFTVVEL